MLILFTIDFTGLIGKFLGLKHCRHFDFKTPIVSIGLFGTFFGVLTGLYGFNTSDIGGSVPHLLEGLKFAFAISVLGMFLSLALNIIDKFTGGIEDNSDILRSIDQKLGGVVTSIQSPAELVSQFTEMKTFLKSHLEKINSSLDKALTQLARGATEEVIRALQGIITEFNQNLQDQFGQNFKELNKACYKMVEWQENYRKHVDKSEDHLLLIIKGMQEARAAVDELTKNNRETHEVCRQVGGLIKSYDIQVQTLATYLESCKRLGDQANSFFTSTERAVALSTKNLNDFSNTIQTSVNKQSESLAQLTSDIDNQLPKALGELEKVLTGITNQFASDYRSLFQFITDKR
jgi:methyl-accepting chemotaxis protein